MLLLVGRMLAARAELCPTSSADVTGSGVSQQNFPRSGGGVMSRLKGNPDFCLGLLVMFFLFFFNDYYYLFVHSDIHDLFV